MAKTERTSKIELEKRIRTVQEWILEDYTYSDIIRSATARWDVCKRTAERYHSVAFRFFQDKNDKTAEQKKAYYKQKKMKLIRDMYPEAKKTPRGVTAINTILDSMAKLDGIIIDKLELTGKNGGPIETKSVDLESLSLEQLKALATFKKSLITK